VSALERLEALGLRLPDVPVPAAAYQVAARIGAMVLTAGQLPMRDGRLVATGHLGRELDTAQGAELARLAALNVLAVAAHEAGDLDRVRVVKLTVFVASTPSFSEQHLVADGASSLVNEVLGGAHARSAVGVAALPLGAPVEVEATLEVLGVSGTAAPARRSP